MKFYMTISWKTEKEKNTIFKKKHRATKINQPKKKENIK